jgi:single-stranded DNA-binding protein
LGTTWQWRARHWKTEIVASSVEMLSGKKKKDYAAESAAEALAAQAAAMGLSSDETAFTSDDEDSEAEDGEEELVAA